MDVIFATDHLRQAFESRKVRVKAWGEKVAGLYVDRVHTLQAVRDAQELRGFAALHFHALKGEWAGEYAINIDRSYRMILTFQNDAMTVARIEEVSNHYGD